MIPNSLDSTARLNNKSRYLVSLMKDTIPDHKLQKAVDILDQCTLALKFYIGTKEPKYFQEFIWAVERLHYLVKGDIND